MTKWLSVALMVAVVLASPGAWAAEIEGKIQSIDTSGRTIVLDNGTRLSVTEGVPLDLLRAGTDVKVSYEERGGENIATRVELK